MHNFRRLKKPMTLRLNTLNNARLPKFQEKQKYKMSVSASSSSSSNLIDTTAFEKTSDSNRTLLRTVFGGARKRKKKTKRKTKKKKEFLLYNRFFYEARHEQNQSFVRLRQRSHRSLTDRWPMDEISFHTPPPPWRRRETTRRNVERRHEKKEAEKHAHQFRFTVGTFEPSNGSVGNFRQRRSRWEWSSRGVRSQDRREDDTPKTLADTSFGQSSPWPATGPISGVGQALSWTVVNGPNQRLSRINASSFTRENP